MTPQELEVAYDQARWAPNMQLMLARFRILSDAARKVVGEPARFCYGATAEEELDLYRARSDCAPIVIFVHGGAWQDGSARESGFLADMLGAAGVHFAAPDFSTIAAANGDLRILVEQVRRAVVWVCKNSSSFGGDPDRIYVAGHSSGAHLAAMALSTNWADYGLRPDTIKGGVLISGIYDLGPLRQTSRSKNVHIDDRVERELSPIHCLKGLTAPLLLGVGSQESSEFVRQTEAYGEAASRTGRQVTVVGGQTYNHFEMLETLGNPHGLMGRELLNIMRIG